MRKLIAAEVWHEKKNYKKVVIALGLSCALLLTIGISYSKVMRKHGVGKESTIQSKDEEKKYLKKL